MLSYIINLPTQKWKDVKLMVILIIPLSLDGNNLSFYINKIEITLT